MVPATPFEVFKLIWAMADPEQTVRDVVVNVTRGMGFTVMLTVVSLKQPLAPALMVNTVV